MEGNMANLEKVETNGLTDVNERLITVGLLANTVTKQTGLRCTPQMINNYEKQGLIRHSHKTKGGFRQFTINDIHIVSCIKHLQSEGLSLAQIKTKLIECPEEFQEGMDPDLPEDRRSQILQASAKVFLQKGYEATTMHEIAEEANISSALIYQYFESKEDLFLAFTENTTYGKILLNLSDSLASKENVSYTQVRQSLIELAIQFSRHHSTNAELFRLLIAEARDFPEICQNYLRRLVGPMEELLERYFNHLVKVGFFRPINTKIAVKIYFGIWSNIFGLRDLHFGKGVIFIPEESEFGEMVDAFLLGMLKNPPP
jgi:AcrR family transcriptional regulator